VGNYALKPTFSDGHDSGLYAWPYLYQLASEQARFEADYVAKLQAAGVQRGAPMVAGAPPSGGSCSS
ncbi:MAG: gamma-butyrobetaine hydroxylase-like domain-containing protein, partial [Burkholderiaceae bacterium]|nr:gamma-butyrobetaine hydroxylase-like domain-containing protein [Burkholderiaceae bacterium]